MTLSDLKPGDRARIDSIETADVAVQRLMVLGLVEGAELTFLRTSLGGDPLERSLAIANACGALSTRAIGGVDAQPTMDEVTDLLEGRKDR